MWPSVRLNVRGRLFAAFLGISAFAVIAAGAALYAFDQAGTVLSQITKERLPPALSALALARQAERVVATTPAMLSAASDTERQEAYDRISTEVSALNSLLTELDDSAPLVKQLVSVRIAPLVLGFEGNLDDLDYMIRRQLKTATDREQLTNRVRAAVEQLRQTFSLSQTNASPQSQPSIVAQLRAERTLLVVEQRLSQIGTIDEVSDLPAQVELSELALAALDDAASDLPNTDRSAISPLLKELRETMLGEQSLLALRKQQLNGMALAQTVLSDNAGLAQHLTVAVDSLVDLSKDDIREASANALDAQKFSAGILIAVVVLSLASSALVAWLYVDRNLVARLKALSDSMLAIAGGNLRAELPSVRGDDEIDRMAGALTHFRDNALVVQENNLSNIAQARARMIDALESTSEGFAFFDADDRLELSNARYRELLHADAAALEGKEFEEILRTSIDRGQLEFSNADTENWIDARVAAHRDPGPPTIQQRGDGRWIMISERKTEGGGIVSVYSDITELKQREAALAMERERLAEVTERLDLALTMDGIGIWDVDLRSGQVWWSEKYCIMLGYGPDEYAPSSTSWEEHLHPDDSEQLIETVDRFLESTSETLRVTQHLRNRHGKDLWTEAMMHVQRNADGKATRLTGIDVDVTDQHLKERQIEAANVEIARKNQELEALSAKLAKYLSPQVYESIFSGRQEVKIASSRKRLTVFFSDIVGFTEAADKLESEELTELLNEYLTEMSKVALKYGATIDKYVGDAIVIFFGDPESRGIREDALACVTMAIAMQKRLAALARGWRDMGIEQPLRCRIGINTGYCTVGNFGSEDRMDYTIIGGGVNLAARLENAAQPGTILISYETYAHIKDDIRCEPRGQIDVKGIAYPVSTFEAIEELGEAATQGTMINERRPHLLLDIDPVAMSADERRDAMATMQRAIERLAVQGHAT